MYFFLWKTQASYELWFTADLCKEHFHSLENKSAKLISFSLE